VTSLLSAHIDLAPTILDIMGFSATPAQMDGASWLPQLMDEKSEMDEKSVQRSERSAWRTEMLIEYNGPSFNSDAGAGSTAGSAAHPHEHPLDHLEVDVDDQGELFDMLASDRIDTRAGSGGSGGCKWFSKASTSACDPKTNTYACVRSIGSTIDANSVYCEFSGEANFVEYYDIDLDPYQLHNQAQNVSINGTSWFKVSGLQMQ
jgi:N-acetylglucosamine-6-sulfatase